MLIAAKKREVRRNHYLRWAIHYQHEVSFEEYLQSFDRPPERKTAEIVEDVYGIITEFNTAGLKDVTYGNF